MKPGNDQQDHVGHRALNQRFAGSTAAIYRALHEPELPLWLGAGSIESDWQGGDIDAGETAGWTRMPSLPEDDADSDNSLAHCRR